MPSEPAVQISGPWTHRSVSANGTRFHVAVSGDGPLVLLLHGFPEFWWTWRHQLAALSAAGYRAVAADLRGYGGSDKPPRGYDLITAAADAAGLIRALGEANAVVVGHDWGGLAAWTLAAYFPKSVRRLAVVSMAHPLQMRATLVSSPLRISRALAVAPRHGYPLAFQLPLFPERQLVRDGAALVGSILSSWSAPGWPDEETARTYRRAMRIPSVAHSALEYHRWFARSSLGPTACGTPIRCGRRSRRRPCTCTARWTRACRRRPRGARAGTSTPRTGGRSSRGRAITRMRNGPAALTPNCSAGSPTPSPTDEPARDPVPAGGLPSARDPPPARDPASARDPARQGPRRRAAERAAPRRTRPAAPPDRGQRRAAHSRRPGGHTGRGRGARRQPAGRRPPVPRP